MGKQWDGGDVAFRPETWAKVLRVLKPGAHLVAFGAPKNYHRLACAIEDAGFEIRDSLMWLFGTGFPKSHNLDGEWIGWGTALKPAFEPIVLARKPMSEKSVAANVLRWGTGALNIDACRVGNEGGTRKPRAMEKSETTSVGGYLNAKAGAPIDAGRWPANICHDGSDEVIAAFPDAPGQQRYVGPEHGDRPSKGIYGDFGCRPPNAPREDSGSAARFFYGSKADSDDRLGSKHPTVKPVDLMQWLCRLITPPKGTVLDCFAGTGTTGEAAWREGFNAVLIEREDEYRKDIARRMELCLAGPAERARESVKARGRDEADMPLFAKAAAE
jgi:site-specific DNA-methyltransferase (adenine-specific)